MIEDGRLTPAPANGWLRHNQRLGEPTTLAKPLVIPLAGEGGKTHRSADAYPDFQSAILENAVVHEMIAVLRLIEIAGIFFRRFVLAFELFGLHHTVNLHIFAQGFGRNLGGGSLLDGSEHGWICLVESALAGEGGGEHLQKTGYAKPGGRLKAAWQNTL